MRKAHIPAGYHDAEGAAILLGVKKRVLLATLRELGWVDTGGDNHNLPRRELKANGWMSTLDGSYCLKGKKEIVKRSSKLLLSQTGFQELKKEMDKLKIKEAEASAAPIPAPIKAPVIKIEAAEKPFDQAAAEIERNKHIAQMAEWGLPIAAGRN